MSLLFKNGQVVGVRYFLEDEVREALFHKEIILCAGAINSPKILLSSGIGPAADLKKLGVGVRRDVPGVGHNLQDHLMVPLLYETRPGHSLNSAQALWPMLKYTLLRRGPLVSNGAEAGGFIRTRPDLPYPDLQLIFAAGTPPDQFKSDGFTLAPLILRPVSRGVIRLVSTDSLDAPLIQPNYLAAAEDWETLTAGVEIAQKIVHQPPFDKYRVRGITAPREKMSAAELQALIRHAAETVYHPVGTCKMGPASDPTAVVDAQLRVYGYPNVRVVDASIMPTLIGGNTNAPVMAIAEKAADLILQTKNS
jgi:choline dehydrogenase